MGFSLSLPASLLSKEIDEVAKKTKRAGVRALNKTATQGRNIAQRETRKVINVKAARIKQVYRIIRARNNQSVPIARIEVRYKRFPLIFFNGVRQTKKGVTVKMRKDRGRKLFKSAFITTVKSGHKGVFWRKGKKRLPIKELIGPNPQAIFVEKLNAIEKQSIEKLSVIYNRELDFIFGRV